MGQGEGHGVEEGLDIQAATRFAADAQMQPRRGKSVFQQDTAFMGHVHHDVIKRPADIILVPSVQFSNNLFFIFFRVSLHKFSGKFEYNLVPI